MASPEQPGGTISVPAVSILDALDDVGPAGASKFRERLAQLPAERAALVILGGEPVGLGAGYPVLQPLTAGEAIDKIDDWVRQKDRAAVEAARKARLPLSNERIAEVLNEHSWRGEGRYVVIKRGGVDTGREHALVDNLDLYPGEVSVPVRRPDGQKWSAALVSEELSRA